MSPSTDSVGVIIGRFHVSTPHAGHDGLIKYVKERHKDVLIVLGRPATYATDHDPLPYDLRRSMIEKRYPDVTIVGLTNVRTDEAWSQELDRLIAETFPGRTAILYGSRDSFRDTYSGELSTEHVPEIDRYNATAIREKIKNMPSKAGAFLRGVIYATMIREPITYPTVDIGVYRRNCDGNRPAIQVLLGRKRHDPKGKYRFFGGFVDPTDKSYEHAIRRERLEESGEYELTDPEYVCSHRVDDWRYRGTKDGIMTILFRAQYLWGALQAADDIEELDWFDLNIIQSVLVEEHLPLGEKYLASFAAELPQFENSTAA